MAQINITADVADAVNAFNQYNTVLGNVNNRIKEVTQSSIIFDNSGNSLSGKIKGLTNENQKFTASLKETNGVLSVQTVQYTNTALSVNKLAEEQRKANAEIQKAALFGNDLTKSLQTIGNVAERFILYRVFNTVTESIKDGVKAARDYQIQISLIRTISQDNQLSSGQWAKGLKDVSDQLGLPLAETAKAAYDAVSNQVVRGAQTFEFIRTAGELARTTGGDIKDATNLLSSAINAYNLDVSEANNLSALFFNTIDEGRVKLNDMADTFGRVAILGKGLGVNLTDITGSIAFLTQKGVTSADALTFMRNVFVQLEKPSKELTAFFQSIGVESGKAAISTFGFLNVISKINEEVKRGNTSVAGLFPEIRAQQPIQAALNDTTNFQRIIKQQEDLNTLTKNYQNAINIRAETPADFINKEFNKLKNTFTSDIGTKINELIKDILVFFSSGKSLSEGLNDIIIRLRNIALALGAFRIALFVTRTGMLAYLGTTVATTQATVGLTAASQTAAVTLRALPFAALAAGVAYLGTKLLFTDDLLKANNEGFEALADKIKKIREGTVEVKTTENPNKDLFKNIDDTTQHALQLLSNVSIRNREVLDNVRENNRNLQTELANSFSNYISSLKTKVNDVRKVADDAQSVVKGLTKSSLDFAQRIEETITNTRLKYATDIQAVKILTDEITKQKAKAKELSLTGSPDDAKEALKIFDSVERLIVQRSDKIVEIAKQGNLNFARDFKGLNIDQSIFGKAFESEQAPFERGGNALTVNVEKLIGKELNQLKSERAVIEKNINSTLTERRQLILGEARTEDERIKNLEAAFKKFNEFSVFNSEGQVKGEFKNPLSGQIDSDKVQRAQERAAKELQKFAGSDLATQLKLQDEIAQRAKQKTQEATLAIRQDNISSAQQQIQQTKDDLKQKLENNQKEINDKAEKSKQLLNQLKTEAKVFGDGLTDAIVPFINKGATQTFKTANNLVDQATSIFGGGTNLESKSPIVVKSGQEENLNTVIDKIGNLRVGYTQLLQLIDNAQKNGINTNGVIVPKREDIEAAQKQVTMLLNETQSILAASQGSGFDPSKPNPLLNGASFNEVKQAMQQTVDELKKNFTTTGVLVGDAGRFKLEFEQGTKLALEALNTQFSAQELRIAKQIEAQLNNTTSLERLTDTLNKIGTVPTTPGRAGGGWIGGRPGYDANLTPTTRGEYIVNADSAFEYRDVLESINSRRGQYSAGKTSNSSSTNVGDIVVNVNVANASDIDARKLAREINREYKRGNLRFNH